MPSKNYFLLKTIAAYDFNVYKGIELNGLMKLHVHEYQRTKSGHYLTFAKGHSISNLNLFFKDCWVI